MLSRTDSLAFIDLLFNVVLVFVAALFFLLLSVTETDSEEMDTKNDNEILITMRWTENVDMDLWIELPDGRRVWYANRDEPPAHLDLDVVCFRSYYSPEGEHYLIDLNEEVVSIRDVIEGEFSVSAHYFSHRGHEDPVDVEIVVYDVKNRRTIYAGSKQVATIEPEVPFVSFSVRRSKAISASSGYVVENVYTDRPKYIVGRPR